MASCCRRCLGRAGALGAISLIAWSPVAAHQTAVPAALSRALSDHLKNERFDIVTSIRGLPLGVRDGLQTLFGGQTLDIAEPVGDVKARRNLFLEKVATVRKDGGDPGSDVLAFNDRRLSNDIVNLGTACRAPTRRPSISDGVGLLGP